MNKSTIFSNAWSIARNAAAKFGGSVKTFFAEALKMAYRATELTVEALVKMGGSEWIKGDYHRVYFNFDALCEIIGLSYSTYKTGNVSFAMYNGSKISNTKAAALRARLSTGKIWFDVKTGEFSSRDMSAEIFETVVAAIKK
ncbi:hypothetical protein [Serratia entomophila]|uniref:hypothetical protein n=1 Tax=Serratia entomophila TaxID=42906 RepID=UPI0021BD9D9A|nr:hypothetical protein [Serratia entomophila]